jgi:hypothetical protein
VIWLLARSRDFLSSPEHPNQFSRPPSLWFSGYKRLFHQANRSQGVNLTTHLYQALRLGISRAVPPLYHMPSWQLKDFISTIMFTHIVFYLKCVYWINISINDILVVSTPFECDEFF